MTNLRKGTENDAQAILAVHVSSVRHICGDYYPAEQIDEWIGSKNPGSYRSGMRSGEIYVVAENAGSIVGFGVLSPSEGEIRAVYVDPRCTSRGIGALILRELEVIAADAGLRELHLKATVNAAGFYRHAGYEGDHLTGHKLKSGSELACVAMTKVL